MPVEPDAVVVVVGFVVVVDLEVALVALLLEEAQLVSVRRASFQGSVL